VLSEEQVCENVPYKECKQAGQYLKEEKRVARLLLVQRTSDPEESVNQRVMIVPTLQFVGLLLEVRQPVSWTKDHTEKLGD